MSKLTVYDSTGASVGDLSVDDSLLVHDKGSQAVHDVVVATLAARRAGTASTKTKGEVAGSNRKPWRQKGTGRARAGYRQSPVWRGGSVVFGPRPRSYAVKVNRKVAKLAFRRAFTEKLEADAVRVVESFGIDEPRTKLVAALVKSLGLEGRVLFLLDGQDRNVALAARNLAQVSVAQAADVDVYELLRPRFIVASRAAMESIQTRLAGKKEKGS